MRRDRGAGPGRRGPGRILTADVDPAEVARGKFDFDVVGHYARPDVFRLDVDEEPRRPVDYDPRDPDREEAPGPGSEDGGSDG